MAGWQKFIKKMSTDLIDASENYARSKLSNFVHDNGTGSRWGMGIVLDDDERRKKGYAANF